MRGRLAVAGKLDLHGAVGGKPTHPLVSSNGADGVRDMDGTIVSERLSFRQHTLAEII